MINMPPTIDYLGLVDIIEYVSHSKCHNLGCVRNFYQFATYHKTNCHFKTTEDIKDLFLDYCRMKLETSNRKSFLMTKYFHIK